ncbi:hypothetical protein GCM10023107_04750 [Actinoplanes octamycinicus]|nr:hypothetical protein Aoc01nite_06370 [Actinoplanes octamycinicus]
MNLLVNAGVAPGGPATLQTPPAQGEPPEDSVARKRHLTRRDCGQLANVDSAEGTVRSQNCALTELRAEADGAERISTAVPTVADLGVMAVTSGNLGGGSGHLADDPTPPSNSEDRCAFPQLPAHNGPIHPARHGGRLRPGPPAPAPRGAT